MRKWRTWWRWWTARYGPVHRARPRQEVAERREEKGDGLPPVGQAAALLHRAGRQGPGSGRRVGRAAQRLQREAGNQRVQRLVRAGTEVADTAAPEPITIRDGALATAPTAGPRAAERAPGSKKEAKRLQKLLDFLARVKAGEEIRLSRRNAKLAAAVLAEADAGTSGFTLGSAERETLLQIQNRGKPPVAAETEAAPEAAPKAEAETEPAEKEVPAEEAVAESDAEPEEEEGSSGYASFSYDDTWARPGRELEFEDFRSVADGSLDPDDAQVEAGIEGRAKKGIRYYYAKLHDTVMEKSFLDARDAELLQHERLHWAIWCRLAQIANEAIAAGVSHTKVDPSIGVGHELTKRYDDETDHSRNLSGQQDWNKNWQKYVDDAFDARLNDG